MKNKKNILLLLISLVLIVLLLAYGESGLNFDLNIMSKLRLPKLVVCMFSGIMLSLAGLIMQIFFQNPIAGPDILGVSTGASLFTAFWVMGASFLPSSIYSFGINIAAFLGAMFVFLFLQFFVRKNNSKLTLLILGILLSSFSGSFLSILINMSSSLQVKNYLVWSQGTFRNVVLEEIPLFLVLSILAILLAFLLKKSFFLFSLGETFAQTLGVNIKKTTNQFIILASIYVAIVTVYCGPIGFIGIVAPHLGKKLMAKMQMNELMLATVLIGIILALFSELILTFFSSLPLTINSILGIFGIPVLVFYIIKSREISL